MHLSRITSVLGVSRSYVRVAVQRARPLSSEGPAVSDFWRECLHRARTIPTKFTTDTCFEVHGSGFFVPHEQNLVFPSLKAAEQEARWLMVGGMTAIWVYGTYARLFLMIVFQMDAVIMGSQDLR